MKKIATFFTFAFLNLYTSGQYCGIAGPSICTPQGGPVNGGFENSNNLPCITQGSSYSNALQFKVPASFLFSGSTLIIDSIQFDYIVNLPCGLCWTVNKTTKRYRANESGCML